MVRLATALSFRLMPKNVTLLPALIVSVRVEPVIWPTRAPSAAFRVNPPEEEATKFIPSASTPVPMIAVGMVLAPKVDGGGIAGAEDGEVLGKLHLDRGRAAGGRVDGDVGVDRAVDDEDIARLGQEGAAACDLGVAVDVSCGRYAGGAGGHDIIDGH